VGQAHAEQLLPRLLLLAQLQRLALPVRHSALGQG
jgi:hypothetical protein